MRTDAAESVSPERPRGHSAPAPVLSRLRTDFVPLLDPSDFAGESAGVTPLAYRSGWRVTPLGASASFSNSSGSAGE